VTALDLPFPDPADHSARAASLRSRDAVQRKDRDAWLALFTADAVVADPVGVSAFDPTGLGHRGADARAKFWDDVIAPMNIAMDIRASRSGGDQVANEATVITTMDDGSRAIVDIVAVYTVSDDGLITSLQAYWELDHMRFEAAG